LRQTQYGVLYTPFLGDLAEVLATAGRLDDSLAAADEALRRTERSDGFPIRKLETMRAWWRLGNQ